MSGEFVSSRYTAGQLNAMVKKLIEQAGENAPEMFLRGELVVKMPECIWKTWKTIKLGFNNVDEICKALKAGKHSICDRANDILGKPAFKISDTEVSVDLVQVSNNELGFKGSTSYEDTCKRAFELGLEYCPAEVGPQLCLQLQLKNQPKGTYVVVAMEAIADSDGYPYVFRVGRDNVGELYLNTGSGRARHVWGADNRFVFLRRK